jgi:electron transfer flavoprotein beta subunit
LPLVSQAAELAVADGKATAKRQTEFGYDRIEAHAPAVIAVSDAINEPEVPLAEGDHGREVQAAGDRDARDLGVDASEAGEAGSKTEVLALGAPPPRGDSRKIEDDGSAAQQVLDFSWRRS